MKPFKIICTAAALASAAVFLSGCVSPSAAPKPALRSVAPKSAILEAESRAGLDLPAPEVALPDPGQIDIPIPPMEFAPLWVESSTNLIDWQFEPMRIDPENPTVWYFEGKGRPVLFFRFVTDSAQ